MTERPTRTIGKMTPAQRAAYAASLTRVEEARQAVRDAGWDRESIADARAELADALRAQSALRAEGKA